MFIVILRILHGLHPRYRTVDIAEGKHDELSLQILHRFHPRYRDVDIAEDMYDESALSRSRYCGYNKSRNVVALISRIQSSRHSPYRTFDVAGRDLGCIYTYTLWNTSHFVMFTEILTWPICSTLTLGLYICIGASVRFHSFTVLYSRLRLEAPSSHLLNVDPVKHLCYVNTLLT